MVPELEDLERKGLFDKQDLRSLVKKRTKFEYALKRRRVAISDFLRYIEYEMNVNALRKERKKRLKIKGKTTVSDYSIDQRIISLFERALIRHSQDKSLWLQFIAFVKSLGHSDSNGYSRLLSKIHARAITSHPYDPQMWIVAADNQFRDNGNGGAARRLMQRALRVNPKSKELWAEYFRLELLLVEKIKSRRRVLGIDGHSENNDEEDDSGFINLPELDEEKKADASLSDEIEEHIEAKALSSEAQNRQELTDEQRAAMAAKVNPYLQGAIARIVYDQAIAAIPSDLEFRKELAAIAGQFPEMEQQRDYVLQTISRDFASDPTAIAYLCTAHLSGISLESPDLVDALRTAVAKFQAAIADVADVPKMWVLYTRFLNHWHEVCADVSDLSGLASYFSVLLKRVYSAVCEDKDKRLNSEIALLLLNNIDDGSKLGWLEDTTARFPTSHELWVHRMDVLTKKSDDVEQNKKSIERIFETQALVACADSQDLWIVWLDWIEQRNKDGAASDMDVQKKYLSAFVQTAKLTSESSGLKENLQIRFVDWAQRTKGLEAMRTAYNTVTRQAFPTLGFYKRCMELESDAKHLVMLHEFACRVNESDMEPWLAYLEFLVKQRRLEDAASVFWRASKALASDEDRTIFDSKYQALLY
ncbi:U3 snoRNP protein [Coemansia sp. RSA 1813]|nr:U3 snoRNP protein [Coemansia sp. RSA 986]KAJ2564957.1 U3 snoRNP protein [Coemansia sp. RSA 1813]